MYHVVVSTIASHRDKIVRLSKIKKGRGETELIAAGKTPKQPNAWASSLSTRALNRAQAHPFV
jgi:hypothetical protein